MIGYVGFSNTMSAVKAYTQAGGTLIWPDVTKYGYGEVHQWKTQGDGGKLWAALDGELAAHGDPAALWWQIGVHTDHAQTALADTAAVLPRIRARFPGRLYVSAINGTDPDGLCPSVDWHTAQAAANSILGDLILSGPLMPALTAAELRAPDYVHPNNRGAVRLGQALLTFDWPEA